MSLKELITAMYFKDLTWISETIYCISCSMVCKIIFCSEFPDIPDKAGRKTRTRRRRRRAQAIAKRYVFHANAITWLPRKRSMGLTSMCISKNSKSRHSQMSFKIGVLKNFAAFTGISLASLFNKFAGQKTCNFIKKRLQVVFNNSSCFPVNIAIFLRTTFLNKMWSNPQETADNCDNCAMNNFFL